MNDNPQTATHPGVIDSIGIAFAMLSRRPYLIWLPLLAELILWSGFRVTIVVPLDLITSRWISAFDVELFASAFALVPTVFARAYGETVATVSSPSEFIVSGTFGGALFISSALLTIILAVGFFAIVARLVTDLPVWGVNLARQVVVATYKLLAASGLVIGLWLLLMLPVMFLGAGLVVYGFAASELLFIAGFLLVSGLLVAFLFVPHALVLDNAGVPEAMRSSYRLIREHTFSASMLILISLIILSGLPFALQAFAVNEFSILLTLIAHAFISTALVTATMIFYRDRRAVRNDNVSTARP